MILFLYRTALAIFTLFLALSPSVAAPSAQCIDEIDTLQETPEIKQATDALRAKLEEYFSPDTYADVCNSVVDGTTNTCEGDFDDFSLDVQMACTNGGGQFAKVDYLLECSNSDGRSISYSFENVGACVGVSCDLEEDLDKFFFASTEEGFENAGYECSSNVTLTNGSSGGGGTTSGSNSNDHCFFISTLVFLLSLFFL